MAGVQINDITLKATPAGTDEVELQETAGGASRKATLSSVVSNLETSHADVLKDDGTTPLTASWDVGAFTITALRFVSDQTTGTAPFTVASTTTVTNLSADTVDGVEAAAMGQLAVAAEWTSTQNFNATTLTDAATISWNAQTNQVTSVTITASRTMGAPTNLVDGAFYSLAVIQGGAGSFTLTWNSVFKWAAGVAPVLTTAAGSRDEFTFKSNGTNLYEVGRSLDVK